ncbi:MAG TPA: NAD-dependent deacylase [Roseiflexaceae bacterium]|nr:NAD-dependent deacylase [Roseiflexaceae bacterium]
MELAQIERAAALLAEARYAVALTGAGLSTPSGIPDFRSGGGLWEGRDPAALASLAAFQRDPRPFFRWFGPLLGRLENATANPAHTALALLEQRGLLRCVITQNIDGLHQRAGSREVYELHGHIRSATCTGCERQVPTAPLMRRLTRGSTPWCGCGSALKPDVVLFDEMLPRGLYWLALRALEQCDTLIVAGTALEVQPVCDLPLGPLRRGARLLIINQSPTYLDAQADVVLRADVAEALPALARLVGEPRAAART